MNRYHRLYKWASDLKMTKRGLPRDDQTIRVPQTTGQSGWLILTRTPQPQAYWMIRSQLSQESVPFVIDDRCFDDTIFRVEKHKTTLYLADVFCWQGTPVWKTMSFTERQHILREFLEICYTPCSQFEWKALKLRSDCPGPYKGFECFSDAAGDVGTFTEDMRRLYTIRKTALPDVYAIEGEEGYLDVPNLTTSQKLRTLGETFQLYCEPSKEDPALWEIVAFQDK